MLYSVHIPRCTHIKTNGTQCGSPALRGRRFCFFHKNWRGERIQLNAPHVPGAAITLPVLEDADSIQVALMQVLRLILGGQIDAKIAGLLLYGLQTASLNLRQMKLEPLLKTDVVVDPGWVRDTGVGDHAWSEEDFEEEEEEEEEDSEDESGEEEVEEIEEEKGDEGEDEEDGGDLENLSQEDLCVRLLRELGFVPEAPKMPSDPTDGSAIPPGAPGSRPQIAR